ncbi:transcriptional regulator [Nitzschia inconspicua]|uniref:Transcriptional regulator n=1 Tax=Nitzschia inconspicua TaxID=303405 RepID=A0A9K3KWT0_9STRA|nr:transcriptional regulator [Nitzschia inconspicua]
MTTITTPTTTETPPSPSEILREIANTRQLVVGILIFTNVEVLDFCGPFEVLSVCRLGDLEQNDNITTSPFSVKLIAKTMDPVTTVGGMQVMPHMSIDNLMEKQDPILLDILIVPGGMGTRTLRNDVQVLDFVRYQAARVHFLASVCTGSCILAQAGSTVVPDGTVITTHWQTIELFQEWYPRLTIDRNHSVTKNDAGDLYTSAGISAGIDMCFRLIKDIFGEETSQHAAKRMEYTYPKDFQRRIDF